jgi:uncharacterized protein
MALVMGGVHHWPRQSMAVAGSSLGGFYARWLALQTGCAKTVLLNPAVFPSRDLLTYVGDQTSWHNPSQSFFFQPAHVLELRAQEGDIARLATLQPATPEHQWSIVAQGDEVLDWREMQAFCAGGAVRLLSGSDHAISDFDEHMDAMLAFLNLQN